MECVITGAAGFIGSHLGAALLRQGHRVVGIDCFTSYYARQIKEANLQSLRKHRWFQWMPLDLTSDPLDEALAGADWVFHLAAMPGLVRSWTHFDEYQHHNVIGTQRLLEALKRVPRIPKLIHASTSSVYGRYALGDESLPLLPSSPYGITKLAAENLVRVYREEFGVPGVVLRFFSVYGPGQRPDMGYHQFIQALMRHEPIRVSGDGHQVRGNTFVSDCVAATIAAAERAQDGDVLNIGGGEMVSVWKVIEVLERITHRKALIQSIPARHGDQRYTGADIRRAQRQLGWEPSVPLEEGLAQQVAWQREQNSRLAA
ncbi:NAD-dependent epimerase/dehydratase family protein [Tuwongella immobilis]|uniref:NAD-dependent epimerase/dehydratase domain-containing protein n=1 Tax=Tuwongella immobilis TaxID=692036 RepID=A0A6C2YTY9_9BACT|nr:NAD-dependent epimerase/dehydratase family protein [Tuwongella immobilis]VIP04352.1 udp-glucose epimerase : NDP-sugar epimerase OS=uncultured planctomycete GN=HGMM_F07G10C14 PE=4 SV=1: Epimerase [Tuwongella immobilis]VTS06066.1 udp-glucose epimerase : NDP-sugar epimerase OS=uncultured planctomycete GN=HGMM_F07G10C14 PE=4 SV=1: Epimerase [Tuwongella immobilis]